MGVVLQRRAREIKEKGPFYSELRRIAEKLPKPFYAYNFGFEKDIIEIELGIGPKSQGFVDLQKPWKSKADVKGLKRPKLDELIWEPEGYIEAIQIVGKDIPDLWKAYVSSGSENLLKMVMQQNPSDLPREPCRYILSFIAHRPKAARLTRTICE